MWVTEKFGAAFRRNTSSSGLSGCGKRSQICRCGGRKGSAHAHLRIWTRRKRYTGLVRPRLDNKMLASAAMGLWPNYPGLWGRLRRHHIDAIAGITKKDQRSELQDSERSGGRIYSARYVLHCFAMQRI